MSKYLCSELVLYPLHPRHNHLSMKSYKQYMARKYRDLDTRSQQLFYTILKQIHITFYLQSKPILTH